LARGGKRNLRRKDLRGSFFEAEPNETRACKDDGVVFAGIHLSQARVDVATKDLHHEVRPVGAKRSLPAQTRCAHARPLRKTIEPSMARRHENVAGILPLGDAREHESRGEPARHVFHGMNREVGASVQKRLFDLLDEEAFATHLGQGPILNPIARRHDLELVKTERGHRRA